MNWPYVHRARLEAAQEITATAQQAERGVREQLVMLVQTLAEMKRAGFEGVTSTMGSLQQKAVEEPDRPTTPSEVLLAISERAVENTPMHRRLLMHAHAQLDGGVGAGRVAAEIREGGNADALLYGEGD